MVGLFWIAAAIWLIMSAIVPACADDLQKFVRMHHCPIAERLEIIHRVSRAGDMNRFIAVNLPGFNQSYVQCLFLDDDGQLVCEAASGYYAHGEDEPRTRFLPAASIAALSDLGFATDHSEGNYYLMVTAVERQDFAEVAELLLSALYSGYGVRPWIAVEIVAPLAPEVSQCTPVG
ncbi:hypothetical protein SAMN04488498_10613 [Mesorhizobium albiziae]|uniref:TY-Chap N-terminal domain-containing protein n=2 Tax=Neomesorhizobium albiziae TaxID=335020 RepID=A0A1I3Z8D1_9HYPH|nr:hypothetical protein SAMN04488498_10613 [Mesorhizobium albiziae]